MTKIVSFILAAPNRNNSLLNCHKTHTGMIFAFSYLYTFRGRLLLPGVFVDRAMKFKGFIEMSNIVKLQKMIQKGIFCLFFDIRSVSWK